MEVLINQRRRCNILNKTIYCFIQTIYYFFIQAIYISLTFLYNIVTAICSWRSF